MEIVDSEFGTIIEAPDDALDWLEEILDVNSSLKAGNWCDCNIMNSRDEGVLLLASFDGCELMKIEFLIEAVCEMQVKFNLDKPWHLTWANIWADGEQWYACGEAAICLRGVTHKAKSHLQWVEETEGALLMGSDMNTAEQSAAN